MSKEELEKVAKEAIQKMGRKTYTYSR